MEDHKKKWEALVEVGVPGFLESRDHEGIYGHVFHRMGEYGRVEHDFAPDARESEMTVLFRGELPTDLPIEGLHDEIARSIQAHYPQADVRTHWEERTYDEANDYDGRAFDYETTARRRRFW